MGRDDMAGRVELVLEDLCVIAPLLAYWFRMYARVYAEPLAGEQEQEEVNEDDGRIRAHGDD
jgi:tRNA G26 N,N-dimethylase Trm1